MIGMRMRGLHLAAAISIGTGGCGTTYALPEVSSQSLAKARQMFAEESSASTSKAGSRKTPEVAARQFVDVVQAVEPVAEDFCRRETADRESFDCDVHIAYNEDASVRNAYQYYDEGAPYVVFTIPMIEDARNEDELAFVLGHEFGHHIGEHIEKQKRQAAAAGIALGALAVVANAYAGQSPSYNAAQGRRSVQNITQAGFALGKRAFSQTYELEADAVGAYIASAAGYDAVRGARYFARPEERTRPDGRLSFWGTHPPDDERIATVIETVALIEAGGGLTKK